LICGVLVVQLQQVKYVTLVGFCVNPEQEISPKELETDALLARTPTGRVDIIDLTIPEQQEYKAEDYLNYINKKYSSSRFGGIDAVICFNMDKIDSTLFLKLLRPNCLIIDASKVNIAGIDLLMSLLTLKPNDFKNCQEAKDKNLLLLEGKQQNKSIFSTLPKDLLNYIADMHIKTVVGNSQFGFFKSLIPTIKPAIKPKPNTFFESLEKEASEFIDDLKQRVTNLFN
jgi:hypothetical protein